MIKNFKVGLRDFSERNAEKLEKIFQATGSRGRTYSIAKPNDPADLLLVDIDEKPFFDSKNYVDAINSKLPIVTVGLSDKPVKSNYHIQGMLLATRVIRVLDQVIIPDSNMPESIGSEIAPDGACYLRDTTFNVEDKNPAYSVLVVDDSELMRKIIGLELGKAAVPLNVDCAQNGEEALAMVAAKTYDFIFLDVMMPGIDGYETCGQIRKIAAMKKTPIIMLSAKTSPLDEVKGVMAGCTNYVTKPIKSAEFQNMLGRIMDWLGNYKKP